MDCIECNLELSSQGNTKYCEKCNADLLKHSLFNSIQSWQESLGKDNVLYFRSKTYLQEYFKDNVYTIKNLKELFEGIKNIIKTHLAFYVKEDIIASMLLNRQYFRAGIDSNDKQYWLWMNEYAIANLLIELTYEIKDEDFVGASIGELDEGYCNLITALTLSRVLIDLEIVQRDIFKSTNEKLSIREILSRIEQDEFVDTYYENARFDPDIEKPEHYSIKEENLLIKLKEMKLDSSFLEEKVGGFLNKKYGVTSEEIRSVVIIPFSSQKCFEKYTFEFYSFKLTIINKNDFYEIIKQKIQIEREKFELIINLFSLQNIKDQDNVNKRIIYELKSILLIDDLVIFGAYDLVQNYGIFKALHYSSHFPHFFIEDYQNNIELMNKEMDDITQHMTSYFVCSVVDVLIQNGYRLPLEKKKYNGKQIYCPRFELKTILNSNQNILAGKGDIDVLALNEHKKVIYNIEVKYYQPAISLNEMRSKDAKRILNKKTIEKIMNRHDALDQNKEAVLKLFDIQDNVDEYNIESLIITARENFFLTSSDFRYYNWNEFNGAIKTKEF